LAEKQITDRSTAADVAEAANQLRSAQQELQQWISQRRQDPTTPREIFEGVDYGPMISQADIAAQSRIISNRYEYVDFGQLARTQGTVNSNISVGGDQFFVRGFGTNPDDLGSFKAPRTSLNANDDVAIRQLPVPGSAPASAAIPGQTTSVYPSTSIGSRFRPVNSNDSRIAAGGVGQDSLPNSNGIVTSDSGVGPGAGRSGFATGGTAGTPAGNDTSVTNNDAVTDDAGGVGGTGVDSGYGPDDDVTELDEIVVGPGGGTGSQGNGTGNGESVDVSQFARPLRGGGKSVEDNKPGVALRPNVLHNYSNWTYNIGLYMLDLESHNNITRNGGITNPNTELRHLLIKSGGGGGKSVLGDKRDYYIENLRFVSIVGQNSRTTKSSNNFDITFEIIEPYGVAFLAELIQYANLIGVEDQFEIPYLMEIKFKGFDETGQPIANISGSGPKYIPIKIIKVEFKINSAATVYTVTAVPYAHSPLQNVNDSVIQESFNIKGQTFEELMASLAEHMNNTERSKAEKQQREPDVISFEIHDNDLKTSRVGFEHVTDGNVVSIDKTTMDNNAAEFIQVHSGTTLKSTIQAIAAATDFGAKYNTTGQPESEEDNENKPFRLLKVIPVVTFETKKYNTSTKKYSRNIVYKIITQKMYGFVTEGMPRAKPTDRGWQKEYNWIFTGKNQDIVDFTAEYNVQYFIIRNNPYRDEKGNVSGTPSAPGNLLPDDGKTRTGAGRADRDQQGFVAGRADRDQQGSATYSPAIVTRSSPASSSIYNSYRGAAHQLASDHMDNILNNPGADMLAIDLTIIGDPDWIPQDRSILPLSGSVSRGDRDQQGSPIESSNALNVNGSIATDEYDIFVMLRFKTPRDYNPEKGLMQIETEKTFVQGLYRVIQLTNNFSDGKFEQTLKMLRVQNQISNDNNNETDLIESTGVGRADRDQQGVVAGRADRDQQGGRVTVAAPAPDEPIDTDPASATNTITEEEQRDVDAFGSLAAANAFRTRENSLRQTDFTRAVPNTGPR
jgi:hypothetical protein